MERERESCVSEHTAEENLQGHRQTEGEIENETERNRQSKRERTQGR